MESQRQQSRVQKQELMQLFTLYKQKYIICENHNMLAMGT